MNLSGAILENIFSENNVCQSSEDGRKYLKNLRPKLSELRRAYRQNDIYVDYTDPQTQEAYLLAYFPHHYQVIEKICREHITIPPVPFNIVCVGGGPLPELLGVLRAFGPNTLRLITITILDKFAEEWEHSHQIMHSIFQSHAGEESQFFIKRLPFDLRSTNDVFRATPQNQRQILREADLIVFQNFFSETDNNDSVLRNLLHLFYDWAVKPGMRIILVDLQAYGNNCLFEKISQNLIEFNLASFNENASTGELRTQEEPTKLLDEDFFADKNFLRPKRRINYCSLVGDRA